MKSRASIFLIAVLTLFLTAGCAAGPGPAEAAAGVTQEIEKTPPPADFAQPPPAQTAEPAPNPPGGDGGSPHRVNLDLANPRADGVVTDGADIRIEKEGVYTLSGALSGGVVVDCAGPVRLVLSGVTIDNPGGAAIYFASCSDAAVEVAENTENTLSDAKKGKGADDGGDNDGGDGADKNGGKDGGKTGKAGKNAKGAIHAAAPLSISGGGTLFVTGNAKHGVACEGALTIAGCALTIRAESDGVHADGDITVRGGTLAYSGGGDGLQSGAGVTIESGTLTLAAQAGGIKCKEDFVLKDGRVVVAGAGKEGIQSGTAIRLLGGSLDIAAGDDPINAQSEIEIAGGRHLLRGGDDGLDSNGRLLITGGATVAFGAAVNYGADCNDNPFVIEGGVFVACGGYNARPSSGTTQGTLVIAGAKQGLLSIRAGNEPPLLVMLPRGYASVLVSAPGIKTGLSYAVTTGGQAEGEGLLDGAAPYTAGDGGREIKMDSLVAALSMF